MPAMWGAKLSCEPNELLGRSNKIFPSRALNPHFFGIRLISRTAEPTVGAFGRPFEQTGGSAAGVAFRGVRTGRWVGRRPGVSRRVRNLDLGIFT